MQEMGWLGKGPVMGRSMSCLRTRGLNGWKAKRQLDEGGEVGREKPVNAGLVSSEVNSFSFALCAMEIHERVGSRGMTRSLTILQKDLLGAVIRLC